MDYFFLHRRYDGNAFCMHNLIIWFAGFLLYRYLMRFDLPIGSTLVDIAATMVLCLVFAPIGRKAAAKETAA